MSTIKWTPKHSRKGGSRGESSRGLEGSSEILILQQGRGEKERIKQESQGGGLRPISLRSFKISLSLQRNIFKNMNTPDITLSHKILLTWLPWMEMSKQSYLDLSSKSHKSCAKALSLWELGPRTLWLTHLYEIHLHICILLGHM